MSTFPPLMFHGIVLRILIEKAGGKTFHVKISLGKMREMKFNSSSGILNLDKIPVFTMHAKER